MFRIDGECSIYRMDDQSAVDPRDTRRFFDERARVREASLDERFAATTQAARAIIEMIARDYNPVRIWQWGSLLDRSRFSEISDIDIAVEGLPTVEAFFDLYGKALALTDFPLDLVELERIERIHADSIRQRGKLAYERP